MNHTSSPNLPITPSTSVSPPINVICKKESLLSGYDSAVSKSNNALPIHYNTSNGAAGNLDSSNRLMSNKDSSSSSGESAVNNLSSSVANLAYTAVKHDPYTSLASKSVDLYLKNEGYSSVDKNFGIGHLSKEHFSSPRVAGNLTPLGSSSSIMTTPSPPVTPQSLGSSGLGASYHGDGGYNGFHWSGGGAEYAKYGAGHHHGVSSYSQSAYNSPYYHSQVIQSF